MKLRKQIHHLHNALRNQLHYALQDTHPHQLFMRKGTGCLMCHLLELPRYPFATLQLARQHGLALEWLPAERELFDLVGETAFQKRIQRDIDIIKNMPKINCVRCGGNITVFMSLKDVAFIVFDGKNKIRTDGAYLHHCDECGNTLTIKPENIPPALVNFVTKKLKRKYNKRADLDRLVKKLKTTGY